MKDVGGFSFKETHSFEKIVTASQHKFLLDRDVQRAKNFASLILLSLCPPKYLSHILQPSERRFKSVFPLTTSFNKKKLPALNVFRLPAAETRQQKDQNQSSQPGFLDQRPGSPQTRTQTQNAMDEICLLPNTRQTNALMATPLARQDDPQCKEN